MKARSWRWNSHKHTPVEERFWLHIRWQPAPEPIGLVRPVPGDCAIWTGSIGYAGYPNEILVAKINGHRMFVPPLRWAVNTYIAPIPLGYQPDHLCRVRACVNPLHAEAVTLSENKRRSDMYGHFKMHCKHGHEFSPANTYVFRNGVGVLIRRCRTCRRGWDKQKRQRDFEQVGK